MGCHLETVHGVTRGATQDTAPGTTQDTLGCRYELPTRVSLGSLWGANRSVTRDTAGCQLGCCPQRDGLTTGVLVGCVSLPACVRMMLFVVTIDVIVVVVVFADVIVVVIVCRKRFTASY